MSLLIGLIKYRSWLPINLRLLQMPNKQNTTKVFVSNTVLNFKYPDLNKSNFSINNCHLFYVHKFLINQQRWKTSKKKKSEKYEEESDDNEDEQENEEEEEDLAKDFKEITIHVTSTRVDAVAKAGFNMSRNKAEKAVLDNLIRLNGEKILKKGVKVNVGDEVDLIKGINAKNENFIDISRLIVKDIMLKSGLGKCMLILKKYKTLTIQNYEDKWKPEEE